MGLIGNQGKKDNSGENIGSKEKSGGNKTVPLLIVLLVLCLGGGGYWAFLHQEELKEKFFPSDADETVQTEEFPGKESSSFLSKLIKKDRTIVVRGTLLGEEGGAAVLVNKKVLPEGTWINGIRILEITNQSIVIQSGGVKRRLQVGESFDPDE